MIIEDDTRILFQNFVIEEPFQVGQFILLFLQQKILMSTL